MTSSLLSRARAWLERLVIRQGTKPDPDEHSALASTEAAGMVIAEITVVSTGWVTRRHQYGLADLDGDQVTEMLRRLEAGGPQQRVSLAGLWRIELRWQAFGTAAVACLLAGGRPATLVLLLAGESATDDDSASEYFCKAVSDETGRPIALPNELGSKPLVVVLRWPNVVTDSGEYDLEPLQRTLAAAFFLRRTAVAAPEL